MKLTQQELAEIREREGAATPGPWHPPHLSDPNSKCQCGSICEEGYCGGIATIHVDNGKDIGEGGNDGPPLAEARANGIFIAASRADIPALLSHITDLEAELAEAREAIDDAPHFEDCAYINGLVSSIGRGKVLRVECSCWKRNAARSKP
jgi:hypothetical protein